VFAMPGQKFFVRRFRLPETSPERLERIINFEARQQIPFPIDKTYLQYQYTPVPEDKEVEVLLVAARTDEIKDFMKLADKAGLKAKFVTVSSLAVFNAQTLLKFDKATLGTMVASRKAKAAEGDVRSAPETQLAVPKINVASGDKGGKKKGLKGLLSKKKKAEEEPVDVPGDAAEDGGLGGEEFVFEEVTAYVNLGAAAFDLVIGQHGRHAWLKFARSVPTGGNELTRAIIKDCGVSSFMDAERIKKHQTRLDAHGVEADDPNLNEEACQSVERAVETRIVSEIRKSLDYFISQPDGMAVDSVVLSGAMASLPGMAEFLEDRLAVPVTVTTEPSDDAPISFKAGLPADLPAYIPALGMALHGLGAGVVNVDFLPEDRKIVRDFPIAPTAVMAALLIGVIAIGSRAGQEYAVKFRTESESARSNLSVVQGQINAARAIQEQHNTVARKYELVSQAIGDREYWFSMLSDIEQVKPTGVMIAQFNGRHDGSVTLGVVTDNMGRAAEFNQAIRDLLEDPREAPDLGNRVQVEGSRWGFDAPQVNQVTITFRTRDKYNLIRVTPTPDPNQPGMLGRPGTRQPGGATGQRQRTGGGMR